MSYKNAASPEEVFSHSCVTQFMGRDIPHWGAPKSPDDLLSALFVWEWIVSLGGQWKTAATSRILLVSFCYMSSFKKIIKFQYLKHSSLCSVHRNYNQSTKFCFVTAAQIQMSSFIYLFILKQWLYICTNAFQNRIWLQCMLSAMILLCL